MAKHNLVTSVASSAGDILASRTASVPVFNELRLALPEVAAEMGCDPEELYITDRIFVCVRSRDTGVKDVPYKVVGHGSLPFIYHTGMHRSPSPGYGLIYYRNKLDPTLRYAVYSTMGPYGDDQYLFVKRGELFKLARKANLQRKDDAVDLTPPVLAPGLLSQALEGTIEFMRNAKDISEYGVRVKQGLLLTGPPGNGKTMLCRYLQQLADKYSYGWNIVSASDIDKAYSEGSMQNLFGRYPFTFFDDIDIGYLHRERGKGAVACAILSAMDGVQDDRAHHLVRVFTTNEDVSDMDPAFSRPGRIDRILRIEKPDREMRSQLVATWHEEVLSHIDVEELLDESDGMSFADIEAVKTLMVTSKIVRNEPWDLTQAIEEFKERTAESQTFKLLGFHEGRKPARKRSKVQSPTEAMGKLIKVLEEQK